MTLEFKTPNEILESFIAKIKEKQQLNNLTALSVAQKAGISKRTYDNFLYTGHITFEHLISVMKALGLIKELKILIEEIIAQDDIEYKKLKKIRAKRKTRISKNEQSALNMKRKEMLLSKLRGDK